MSTSAPVMPRLSGQQAGIGLMCLAMLIFAFQDTLSKYLVAQYDVFMVTAIRYWFMALFATVLAARHLGGLRATIRTRYPLQQIARGLLLATQICIMVTSFVLLGLIETHAIFAACPLLIAALARPFLGEHVSWRSWIAIAVGFFGVLIILKPGFGVFSVVSRIAVAGCFVFAAYSLLTRFVAGSDQAATSFFWTGIVGMVALTPLGLWNWEPMAAPDYAVMAVLCVASGAGHFTLIRAYTLAEANVVQPFSYLQLVFATVLAVIFFGEAVELNVAIGAILVGGAGRFTLLSQRSRP